MQLFIIEYKFNTIVAVTTYLWNYFFFFLLLTHFDYIVQYFFYILQGDYLLLRFLFRELGILIDLFWFLIQPNKSFLKNCTILFEYWYFVGILVPDEHRYQSFVFSRYFYLLNINTLKKRVIIIILLCFYLVVTCHNIHWLSCIFKICSLNQ